ncbi:MAG: hypothetical protein IJ080_06775 [Oscillospiraceae bacterium]|nr:hypothetical protein [Oscillospiraceae bacterium]MBQ8979446.1 hypothetical protein [Oscillospiraceae bacterium]
MNGFTLRYLSAERCALCRECCLFDRYDVYDTPLITAEDAERIHALHGGIRFIPRPDGEYIFDMECVGDVRCCPALGERGCILGRLKPVECLLYPYMMVRAGERIFVAVSDLCPVYREVSDELLRAEVQDNISFFVQIAHQPRYVREYDGQRLIKEIP